MGVPLAMNSLPVFRTTRNVSTTLILFAFSGFWFFNISINLFLRFCVSSVYHNSYFALFIHLCLPYTSPHKIEYPRVTSDDYYI